MKKTGNSKFPTMEQVNNATILEIQSMYNQYSGPVTAQEVEIMKTIVRKHMRIRRLKREGILP